MKLWPRWPGRKALPDNPIHALSDNYDLSAEQHTRCVRLVEGIQSLYDNAPFYVDRNGLDPRIAFPGNEWGTMVQTSGIKFRTAYPDINYLRMAAPFIGFHLPILDRMDRRSFPGDGGEEFVAQLAGQGIPPDIADILPRRMNMRERLVSYVAEYENFVRNVPPRYVVAAPRTFGEIGIEVAGAIANPDTIMVQSRVNGLLSSGVLDKLDADIARRGRARALEVGPGYGALAYALKSIFKDKLEYIVVDLPTSLYHSALYLATLSGEGRSHLLLPSAEVPETFDFLFVANYLIEEFANRLGPIDLAMNTMSFPEMSEVQVRSYAEVFHRLLRPEGVVFDENGVFLPHHVDSDAILAEYFPYHKRVSSILAIDRNWQSVWAMRYVGEVFDRSDTMLSRRHRPVDGSTTGCWAPGG